MFWRFMAVFGFAAVVTGEEVDTRFRCALERTLKRDWTAAAPKDQDRILAAYALAKSGKRGVRALADVAQSGAREARVASTWALRFAKAPLIPVGPLSTVAADDDETLALVAVGTACALGPARDEFRRIWRRGLESPEVAIRELAAANALRMDPELRRSLPWIELLLDDPSEVVRRHAVSSLAGLDTVPTRTVARISRILRLGDGQLRDEAAGFMGRHAPQDKVAADVVLGLLRAGSAGEHSIVALGNMPVFAERSIPLLRRLLGRGLAYDRYIAARSLATLGDASDQVTRILARWALDGLRTKWPKQYLLRKEDGRVALRSSSGCIQSLLHFLDSSEMRDVRLAALVLPQVGVDASMYAPRLIRLVDKGGPASGHAIRALRMSPIRTDECRQALRKAALRCDEDTVAALALLWDWERDRSFVTRRLLALMGHETTRSNAIVALGELKPRASEAVPALVEAIHDHGVAPEVARALGRIGARADLAVPALLGALNDCDVRRDVVEALGAFPDRAQVIGPRLAPLLEDKIHRCVAADALSRLEWSDDGTMKVLRAGLLSRDLSWAKHAVDAYLALGNDPVPVYADGLPAPRAALALGFLGPRAKTAIPFLLRTVESEHRTQALWALGRIGLQDDPEAVPVLARALLAE